MSRRAVLLLVLAVITPAGAYDSQCSRPDGSACESGPDAGHNRWLGPSAEHEIIWEHTRALAGLPATVSGTRTLDVFTSTDTVPTGAGLLPTLIPAPFAAASRVRQREISTGELAQLPDFSYALWDWALGNETCPFGDGSDPITCHDFRTHMGPVNSNHFLPQARAFYGYYHALALGRAAACRELAGAVGTQAARFRPILEACEDEALMLEAVGHHYLQDAWSTGHMWERWGSPDLAAFADPIDAIAVAMASGLIHGARGVLQPKASSPLAPFIDVPDALCAPSLGVQWLAPGMFIPSPGLGDLYYPRLTDPAEPFGEQAVHLFSCAAAGMREVYVAAGQQHGPLGPLDASLEPLDAVADDYCFAQRATNLAMLAGAGLDLVDKDGTPYRIALDGDFATMLVIAGAEGGAPSETRQERYRLDMADVLFRIEVGAAVNPNGVDAASGSLGTLLGVQPNGAYVTSPPAPYIDPALPWSADDARTKALVRTFHRAHAADLCRAMGSGGGEAIELSSLRDRARSALPLDEHATALAACAELAARHLRFGEDATDYDSAHEPLCAFVAGTTQFAYTGEEGDVGPDDFAATRDAAASWCVATTTTTSTSSTTTTLPLGARVQLVAASSTVSVQAGATVPNMAPVVDVASDTATTYPYSGSRSAAAAASASPPLATTAAAGGDASQSATLTFDAEGNLVAVDGSGAVGGFATLSNREPSESGASATGYSQLFVEFHVIGGPVAYTLAGGLTQGGNPDLREGGLANVSLYRVPAGVISFHSSSTGGVVADSGVLASGDYVLNAIASLIIDHDPDTDFAFTGEGRWTITLTLGPAGGG